MTIDESFEKQIKTIFRPLNTATLPEPASFSMALKKNIPKKGKYGDVGRATISCFGTAAVDMWHRSVHSFLISVALADVSPVWASVSGYYSSHYSVRGLAHLLGYFYIHKEGIIVRVAADKGANICAFGKRADFKQIANLQHKGEHDIYWTLVNASNVFSGDPLFTKNDPYKDESDSRHRNHANYADNIRDYPIFNPPDRESLKNKIDRISKISFTDPRLPDVRKFPDTETVQLLAYHRLVAFRTVLNNTLGGENNFWNVHRNPSFARDYTNFQLSSETSLLG